MISFNITGIIQEQKGQIRLCQKSYTITNMAEKGMEKERNVLLHWNVWQHSVRCCRTGRMGPYSGDRLF